MPALRITTKRFKLLTFTELQVTQVSIVLTFVPILYGLLTSGAVISGHVLATWRKQGIKLCDCKLLKHGVLLVEQRGVEPLTSALRTRRSAKLSYCPTREAS